MNNLPALDAHLGFWLRYVSNHVSQRFQKLLENRGVSVAEWVALRTLLDQPQTSHAQLITALGMTKGAASKVISKLEEKGFVSRTAVNGREQLVSLTAEGQSLLPALAALADANESHFFGHLPAAERQQLQATLTGLVQYHRFSTLPTE